MSEIDLRELDAWIAEHVFGWTDIEIHQPLAEIMEPEQPAFRRGYPKKDSLWQHIPQYTTDHAAAFAVLEKCAEKTCVEIRKQVHGGEKWAVWEDSRTIELHTTGLEGGLSDSLPLSICLFAKQLFNNPTALKHVEDGR